MTLRQVRIAGFIMIAVGLAWMAFAFWQAMPVSAPPQVSVPAPPAPAPPAVGTTPDNPEFDLVVSEWSSNPLDVTLAIWLSIAGLMVVIGTTGVSIFRRWRLRGT